MKIFKSVYTWIVIGLMATASYILTYFLNCGSIWIVILNVFAMLGSGIFCSAIVSLYFEKATKRKNLEEQQQKREFYFSYISFSIQQMIINELKNTHDVLNIGYNDDNSLKSGTHIEEAISKMREVFDVIQNDEKSLDKMLNNNEILCDYEWIDGTISRLLEQNVQFVLSNIISPYGINLLHDLSRYTKGIIESYNNQSGDNMIKLKIGFYDNAKEFLKIVEPHYSSMILNFTTKESKK